MGGAPSRPRCSPPHVPLPLPLAPAGFAPRLQPPYYAVIFTSHQRAPAPAAAAPGGSSGSSSGHGGGAGSGAPAGGGDGGYAAAAARMVELAHGQPGFLGVESARGSDGLGITVSYWRTAADVAEFRRHSEHAAARAAGRAAWYAHYELRVARVERAYGWDAGEDGRGAPAGAAAAWGDD